MREAIRQQLGPSDDNWAVDRLIAAVRKLRLEIRSESDQSKIAGQFSRQHRVDVGLVTHLLQMMIVRPKQELPRAEGAVAVPAPAAKCSTPPWKAMPAPASSCSAPPPKAAPKELLAHIQARAAVAETCNSSCSSRCWSQTSADSCDSRDSLASRDQGCRHRSRSRNQRLCDRIDGNPLPEHLARLSHKMTGLLRYRVADSGVLVDPDGFVPLVQVLRALRHDSERDALEVIRLSKREDGSLRFERRAGQRGEVLIRSVLRRGRPLGGRPRPLGGRPRPLGEPPRPLGLGEPPRPPGLGELPRPPELGELPRPPGLGEQPHRGSSPDAQQQRLSRACSYILRHRQPAPNELVLPDGFTPISRVMKLLQPKYSPTFDQITQLVQNSIDDHGLPRFELKRCGDQTWMRATSRHTTPGMNL